VTLRQQLLSLLSGSAAETVAVGSAINQLAWCYFLLTGPYWPLSMRVRNSVRQDGDHHRNPSVIYNYNILDAGLAMLQNASNFLFTV